MGGEATQAVDAYKALACLVAGCASLVSINTQGMTPLGICVRASALACAPDWQQQVGTSIIHTAMSPSEASCTCLPPHCLPSPSTPPLSHLHQPPGHVALGFLSTKTPVMLRRRCTGWTGPTSWGARSRYVGGCAPGARQARAQCCIPGKMVVLRVVSCEQHSTA
jgi:hypothetical protein